MNAETRRKRLSELAGKGLRLPTITYSALEADVPPASIRTWSWWAYLWDRPRASSWDQTEWELEDAQEKWDASQKHVTSSQELETERHAREAAEQAERDELKAAESRKELDAMTERLKAAYMDTPGATEESFAAALPEMLDQRARTIALDSLDTVPSVFDPRTML